MSKKTEDKITLLFALIESMEMRIEQLEQKIVDIENKLYPQYFGGK